MKYIFIKEGILIPYSELKISAARSGGPGGQHVNKTSTKIVLKWNIRQTSALTEEQKNIILKKMESQLTSEGDLVINNNETRSQIQNKKLAIDKLKSIINQALYVPKKRKKTKIPKNIKESILKKKKERSKIKTLRKKNFYD